MKKIMISLLLLSLLLVLLPMGTMAAELEPAEPAPIREPGQCGDGLTWSYDAGTLTVSGFGTMDDYPDEDAPWLIHREEITRVVFSGGVTYIGENAFHDYDAITEVDFGAALHTIGVRAFKSCDGLTSVTLPDTFRRFGEECFMSCQGLKEIHCRGGMPSFNMNCVWDVHANIYYPSNNPWPAEHVLQLYNAFQGRISFYMAGQTETVPVEIPETTQATEAVTEPATVPATEPVQTVPETTQAPTQPATEAPEQTLPATQPVPQIPEETEPVQKEEGGLGINGIWFGLFLITGTLSLVLIGALIFRRKSY